MSVTKFRGLILNEKGKGEADKLLTIFTLEQGKATVYAKGARKLKSNYFAGSGQFDYSDFVLFSGRDFYSATQIDKVEGFKNITTDFDRLCYGNYFLEMVDKTTYPGEANPDILRLLLYALRALDKGSIDNFCIGRAFEFKYMQLYGYTPAAGNCGNCGGEIHKDQIYFGFDGAVCGDCLITSPDAVKINYSALYAIQYILNSQIKDIFSFKLDEITKKYLKMASELFMTNLDVSLNGKKFIDDIESGD